jgi:hypothetical protein
MKGVYSSPDSVLARECQQALFPDNTYGVDSGGDPRNIPDLGFKEFQDFHGGGPVRVVEMYKLLTSCCETSASSDELNNIKFENV